MGLFRLLLLTSALALSGGQSAAAQEDTELFAVPPGCEAFLTVQSRSCLISHYWRCIGDDDGVIWRGVGDGDGLFSISQTDSEFRWLQSWRLRSQIRDTLVEPETDPASLSELLETGRDTMVFSIAESGPNGQFRRDYEGFDALTGDAVVIDGVRLLVTEFAYEWQTGAGPRRTEGSQFVWPEMRLFFGGIETVSEPDGSTFEGNYSPVDFAQAGEDGFLATRPEYDCGDMMSGMPSLPEGRG